MEDFFSQPKMQEFDGNLTESSYSVKLFQSRINKLVEKDSQQSEQQQQQIWTKQNSRTSASRLLKFRAVSSFGYKQAPPRLPTPKSPHFESPHLRLSCAGLLDDTKELGDLTVRANQELGNIYKSLFDHDKYKTVETMSQSQPEQQPHSVNRLSALDDDIVDVELDDERYYEKRFAFKKFLANRLVERHEREAADRRKAARLKWEHIRNNNNNSTSSSGSKFDHPRSESAPPTAMMSMISNDRAKAKLEESRLGARGRLELKLLQVRDNPGLMEQMQNRVKEFKEKIVHDRKQYDRRDWIEYNIQGTGASSATSPQRRREKLALQATMRAAKTKKALEEKQEYEDNLWKLRLRNMMESSMRETKAFSPIPRPWALHDTREEVWT